MVFIWKALLITVLSCVYLNLIEAQYEDLLDVSPRAILLRPAKPQRLDDGQVAVYLRGLIRQQQDQERLRKQQEQEQQQQLPRYVIRIVNAPERWQQQQQQKQQQQPQWLVALLQMKQQQQQQQYLQPHLYRLNIQPQQDLSAPTLIPDEYLGKGGLHSGTG